MRGAVTFLFVCLAASVRSISIIDEEPTEPVPLACSERVQPLIDALHTSLHDQRHQVHVQCREHLRVEREQHRREKENLRRSEEHCRTVANSLPNKQEAAELIQQCDNTVKHLLRDRSYINAITHIREGCKHQLLQVVTGVHHKTVKLIDILSTCSRKHACFIYELVKRSILDNVDDIHSEATGDVQAICRRPNLIHHLRRGCERFNLTSSILIDVETILPRHLHQRVFSFCAGTPAPPKRLPVRMTEERTEAATTKAKPRTAAPETEAPQTEAPQTEAVATEAPQTQAAETEAPETEAVETEPAETEGPHMEVVETEAPQTEAAETVTPKMVVLEPETVPAATAEETATEPEGIPGWKPIFGIGPEVVEPDNTDDENKEESTLVQRPAEEEPHSHHHHHHSHRSLTYGMIAAVAVLCIIVTVLSATLTVMILRRRSARRVPSNREVKVPLTDDDQLEVIKTKGYENPTYVFFEGTDE